MVQVNDITTRTVKELANAVNGVWDSSVSPKCRYAVVGHVAFVECVGDIGQYSLPVTPFNGWFMVSSAAGGWRLYQAIIQ